MLYKILKLQQFEKEIKCEISPYTKIQMVLMDNNRDEVESFFLKFFNSIVDEVTVTPYQERGGGLEDLNKTNLENFRKILIKK